MKLKKYRNSPFVFTANGLEDGDHLHLLNKHSYFILGLIYEEGTPCWTVDLSKFEHNKYEFFEIRYEL